jgi:alpha-glucoside transport system permease protein
VATKPLTTAVPAGRLRRPRRTSLRESLQGLLFAGPALLVLGLFLVYPAVQTIRLAFYRGSGFRFEGYLGLDNFKELLGQDPDFLDVSHFPPTGALVNNLKWVVVYTAVCLLFGLALAVLTIRVRYEPVIKSVIFLPMAISATAVGVIWLFVYSPNPKIGVINAVAQGIGHGFEPIAFLGRADTVNWAIIFAYVWASTGFAMVVLSAALKGIPAEIVEAARVDGATEWDVFRRVMLPLLSLPLAVVTVWLFINVIKVFDIIYVMTSGGPNGASRVIAYKLYVEALQNGRWGYGASVAVLMLLLMVPVMALNVRRFRSARVTG